ncbi:MAG: branched-chain amino acid ABC transporter permease [Thermoproteota archaeon]
MGEARRYLLSPFVALLLALLIAVPFIFSAAGAPFYVNMIFLSLMYGIAALAWNLMQGYTGMFSLGHAVFFGLGAYTVMVLLVRYGVTPWLGIWVGGAVASLAALVIGFPLLRLRSHWFTLATIAVGEVFKLAFAHWEFVGAARGLQAPIVEPSRAAYYAQFPSPLVYVYVALGVLAVELALLYRVVNSRLGYYFQAIREDELAAKMLGVDTFRYRMLSLLISSFFTGLAGALYAVRFRYVDPFAVFDLITVSTYIAIAGIVGGIYSFVGPLVGAFVFVPAAEYVRAAVVSAFPRVYGLHVVVVGVILLAISLLAPEGIMGVLSRRGLLERVVGGEGAAPRG